MAPHAAATPSPDRRLHTRGWRACVSQGAKKGAPPLGVQPATFLRFILLSDHGEGVSLPGPAGVSAVADAVLLAGEEGIARTAAQPYSGIRGQYSWEELAEGELCIELPEGSARPPYILAQLWEDPNHASNNRARVPKLNALKPLKGGPTAPTPPAGTDAMAGGALPLASAVIQLRPPANAPAAGDGTGEMEVRATHAPCQRKKLPRAPPPPPSSAPAVHGAVATRAR